MSTGAAATRRTSWRRPALQRVAPELSGAPPDEVVAGLLSAAIERDGEVRWLASGRSMAGSIRHGTTLCLVAPSRRPLHRGDVVAAVLPDGLLVLHRVRAVRSGRLVLRGDACRKDDPPVDASSVIGVVEPRPSRRLRSLIRRYMP